jgi:hypothetical protein
MSKDTLPVWADVVAAAAGRLPASQRELFVNDVERIVEGSRPRPDLPVEHIAAHLVRVWREVCLPEHRQAQAALAQATHEMLERGEIHAYYPAEGNRHISAQEYADMVWAREDMDELMLAKVGHCPCHRQAGAR